MPFYGHIGNPDDCWGCHGFDQVTASSAPGTGSIVPYIGFADLTVVTSGTDTSVTLSGSAFTNTVAGYELSSIVVLTAADGSFEMRNIPMGMVVGNPLPHSSSPWCWFPRDCRC